MSVQRYFTLFNVVIWFFTVHGRFLPTGALVAAVAIAEAPSILKPKVVIMSRAMTSCPALDEPRILIGTYFT